MIDTYIDPIDGMTHYTSADTIAIGIGHERGRSIAIKGLSRHNVIFDAFRDPALLLPIFFTIPCFFRLLDPAGYALLQDEIIAQYSLYPPESLVPLVVFGDCEVYRHPLIYRVSEASPTTCWQVYNRCHRRAKRLAMKEQKWK